MQLNGKTEAGPSLVKSGHLFAGMLMETGPVMPRVMPGKCRFSISPLPFPDDVG